MAMLCSRCGKKCADTKDLVEHVCGGQPLTFDDLKSWQDEVLQAIESAFTAQATRIVQLEQRIAALEGSKP